MHTNVNVFYNYKCRHLFNDDVVKKLQIETFGR